MKVAKDWERFPIAMLGRFVPVVRLNEKRGFVAGVYPPQASKAMCVRRKLRFGVVDYSLNWRNDLGISIVD